jgi:hypothetical protein
MLEPDQRGLGIWTGSRWRWRSSTATTSRVRCHPSRSSGRAGYDDTARYAPGAAACHCPPRLDAAVVPGFRRPRSPAHHLLGLRDLSRMDAVVDGEGRVGDPRGQRVPGPPAALSSRRPSTRRGRTLGELFTALVERASTDRAVPRETVARPPRSQVEKRRVEDVRRGDEHRNVGYQLQSRGRVGQRHGPGVSAAVTSRADHGSIRYRRYEAVPVRLALAARPPGGAPPTAPAGRRRAGPLSGRTASGRD